MNEPEAYTIGWQPFLGLKIYLDSRPLIPRPETEWWTEHLLAHVGRLTSNMGFLDLCAGSGAIGCAALARLPASPELQRGEPNAQVFFGEIDSAHEATILKNIRENNLDASRADVRIGDLFEPFKDLKFDFIAVNPPYIPTNRVLPASVADYEPKIALRSGVDGLDLMRRIAAELPKHLARGGVAWIECDSSSAVAASGLFAAQGFTAEIRTDQYDRQRIIVVSLS